MREYVSLFFRFPHLDTNDFGQVSEDRGKKEF